MEHCQAVVIDRRIVILVKQPLFDQLPDGFQSQIGIHRAGPVSQKGCEMMYLPGLSGFQDQGKGGLLLGVHQVLMDRGHSQKRGNGHMVFIHAPVREDQDIGAVFVSLIHLHEKAGKGSLKPGALIISDGHRRHLKSLLLHVFDLQKVRAGQDRILNLQYLAVVRRLLQQVPVFPCIDRGAGDDLLPDGVNGRIGHLGKQLFKIIEQRTGLLGEYRQRGVHPHGGNALASV